jgi:hypothetical protein
MAKQTFTTGQVLTAAQMTSLQQTAMGGGSATAKTADYTLVAADAGTTIIMNSGSATTITVNTSLFAAGDTVFIVNQGAGVCTITAGTATVSTAGSLAMDANETGQLYFLSTSAAIFSEYTQSAGSTSKFIQMVSSQTGAVATGTNTIPLDDSIPQSSEGDQYMSVSITPTSATNRLLIQVVTNSSADSIKTNTAALFVDSVANSLAAVSNTTRSGGDLLIVSFNHNMVAGSTSAMTFKVRMGTDSGGTLTFNGSGGSRRYGGVIASSITITEYTP